MITLLEKSYVNYSIVVVIKRKIEVANTAI